MSGETPTGETTLEFLGIRAIVTGGASGNGAATAALLTSRGARVAVLDVNPEQASPDVLAIRCDVADDAGIGAQGTIADNDDGEWHRVLDINVLGLVRVSRTALPHLRRSPSAAIVKFPSA